MSKRRTRKDKESAKHSFLLSWEPEAKRAISEPRVKGQIENKLKTQNSKVITRKNADNLAKGGTFLPIKRDVLKSLGLASLILSLELVIYLAWSR